MVMTTDPPLTAHQQLAKWDRYIWQLAKRSARGRSDRDRSCCTPEDLHSEIVLHALRYFSNHDPAKGAFSTWLTLLAKTVSAGSYDRHARTLPAISLSSPIGSDDHCATLSAVIADRRAGPDAVEVIGAKERDAAVRAAVAALPDAEREAVTTRFWTDAIVRDPRALARGLERLQSILDPPERDDE